MIEPSISVFHSRDDLRMRRDVRAMSAMPIGDVDSIVLHHTTGRTLDSENSYEQWWRNIQVQHMDTKGWSDIGYHSAVLPGGQWFAGRDARWVGAHCKGGGMNPHSWGIAVLGDGDDPAVISPAMLSAVVYVIQVCQFVAGRPLEITAHRDHDATHCNGDVFYEWLPEIRDSVNAGEVDAQAAAVEPFPAWSPGFTAAAAFAGFTTEGGESGGS